MWVHDRAIEQQQEKRELMRHYIAEDEKMRAEYRERERERTAAEEQRIAAFAREQAQRDQERRAVKSAQNEYREHLQQQVVALPLLLHIDAAASAPAITHFSLFINLSSFPK